MTHLNEVPPGTFFKFTDSSKDVYMKVDKGLWVVEGTMRSIMVLEIRTMVAGYTCYGDDITVLKPEDV